MGMTGQLEASASLLPRKYLAAPMGEDAGLNSVEERKHLPHAGNQTSPIQPVGIPTELSIFLLALSSAVINWQTLLGSLLSRLKI
jgi:hypothetical protein